MEQSKNKSAENKKKFVKPHFVFPERDSFNFNEERKRKSMGMDVDEVRRFTLKVDKDNWFVNTIFIIIKDKYTELLHTNYYKVKFNNSMQFKQIIIRLPFCYSSLPFFRLCVSSFNLWFLASLVLFFLFYLVIYAMRMFRLEDFSLQLLFLWFFSSSICEVVS